jgi:hypothetical protein
MKTDFVMNVLRWKLRRWHNLTFQWTSNYVYRSAVRVHNLSKVWVIKRMIVLLFYSTLRWVTLYICWRCPDRSYLARYTVILVTSRDCSHITWFRNPASVSLLATICSIFQLLTTIMTYIVLQFIDLIIEINVFV